jgi:hypothetical protein
MKKIISKIARLIKSLFLKRGLLLEKTTSANELNELFKLLRPVKTKYNLIRVGGDEDGGYLLPNDLEMIEACYSPGVGSSIKFEIDLFEKFKIGSHLADYSVDDPANKSPAILSFTKKYLGSITSKNHISFDDWIDIFNPVSHNKDLIMQMDIEGGEYETLMAINEKTLKRFRIIVLELHDIEAFANRNYFKFMKIFFHKLLKHHNVVHIHPNNAGGIKNISGKSIPQLLEVTLIRKDRAESKGFVDNLPHALDRKNIAHLDDIELYGIWN